MKKSPRFSGVEGGGKHPPPRAMQWMRECGAAVPAAEPSPSPDVANCDDGVETAAFYASLVLGVPDRDGGPDDECAVCDVCGRPVRDAAAHALSLVHVRALHTLHPPAVRSRKRNWAIPEHNAGFRALLRLGWDAERGLGRAEDGRLDPVLPVPRRGVGGVGVRATDVPAPAAPVEAVPDPSKAERKRARIAARAKNAAVRAEIFGGTVP